jgi:hypothetical protein
VEREDSGTLVKTTQQWQPLAIKTYFKKQIAVGIHALQ